VTHTLPALHAQPACPVSALDA
jgi:hypothetical protein